MTWKTYLKPDERQELDALEQKRTDAAKAFEALRRKLHSRCQSRMRKRKKPVTQ